jgi:hypothetical protein
MKQSRYAGAEGRPVFVGGCPRSGTTMLRTMLNSHPELAMPHETRFLVDAFRKRAKWGDMADVQSRRKLARWVIRRKKSRVERLVDDPQALLERMVHAPPTLGSVLSTGFQLYAERQGKPRWGDKRPSYVLELDAVMKMFPDAQFVNVVRDPRAAVASIRKIGWYKDGIVAGTALWEQSLRASVAWKRRLAPDQFLEIRYETLVADTRPELERLIEFLGLSPDAIDDMLSFHENADIRSKKMHPLVSQPVTTAAVRSWEEALTAPEVAFIERSLAKRMRRYGYEPSTGATAVPRELGRRLRKRRMVLRKERARTWATEQKLRVTYPGKIAAASDDR